jgi:hypothetical protein
MGGKLRKNWLTNDLYEKDNGHLNYFNATLSLRQAAFQESCPGDSAPPSTRTSVQKLRSAALPRFLFFSSLGRPGNF